jgi:phosphohistidine phosphatase
MDVYFLRHASAGVSVTDRKADEKRPLDALGVEQCSRIGRVLTAIGLKPDVILSSPLTRAMQTAARVASELGYQDSVILEKALRPEADYEQFQAVLRRHSKRETIVVVGHNPNLSEFLSLLVTQQNTDAAIELKKGAVAKVDLKKRSAALEWLLTPKAAQAIQETTTSRSRPNSSRK